MMTNTNNELSMGEMEIVNGGCTFVITRIETPKGVLILRNGSCDGMPVNGGEWIPKTPK